MRRTYNREDSTKPQDGSHKPLEKSHEQNRFLGPKWNTEFHIFQEIVGECDIQSCLHIKHIEITDLKDLLIFSKKYLFNRKIPKHFVRPSWPRNFFTIRITICSEIIPIT